MSLNLSGGLMTERSVITSNAAPVTVYDPESRTTVVSIIVTPTNATPNLSISIYDGTTRTYLRKAVAMTAGTAFTWEVPFVIDAVDLLEVTSSAAAGDMDVIVNFLNPVAAASLRPGG
jgi:hypothetical protein